MCDFTCVLLKPTGMKFLECSEMADVIVKVFRGEVEVACKLISSPVTASEAYSVLQNVNARWVGTLIQPISQDLLVGQQKLTPGRVYHLHLNRLAGKHYTDAPAYVIVGTKCNRSTYRDAVFLVLCLFCQYEAPQQQWDPAAAP